jgi:transcriptional regulator with XRE-family HTH domain
VTINTHESGRRPTIGMRHRLRIAREEAGLEQIDIAKELGVGRSTVSNYERGLTVPGKLVINAWAVVCDVDVEWLKANDEAPAGQGPDGGGGATVHPLGLEPRTHWLIDSARPVRHLRPALTGVAA